MLAGDLAWLATRLCDDGTAMGREVGGPLDVAGDALAAVADGDAAAARLARLAATASGAESARLWRLRSGGWSSTGRTARWTPIRTWSAWRWAILDEHRTVAVQGDRKKGELVTLQLGQPPLGALQLRFAPGRRPGRSRLASSRASPSARHTRSARPSGRARPAWSSSGAARCSRSSARRSHGSRSRTRSTRRSSALGDMLGADRVAVYLSEDDGRIAVAASQGVDGPHEAVASACSRSPSASRQAGGVVEVDDASVDERLEPARPRAERVGDRLRDRAPAHRRRRADRPARRLPASPRPLTRTSVRSSLRSPRSSPSRSRTRVCTSARRRSAASSRRRSARSGKPPSD